MCSTGYANQTRNILKRLSKEKDFEVAHLAWNYVNQTLKKVTLMDGEELDFVILPGTGQQHARDTFAPYIRQIKPDVSWVLLDTFMLYPWALDIDFSPSRSIFYFPTDGDGFPTGCDAILRKFDFRVAMAKYGQKQVKDEFGIDAHYIPHGVDTNFFKPFSQKEKQELKKVWKIENKFVFLTVGRNQGRKNHQGLVKAFAKFAEGKDDVVLIMHMDANDPAAINSLPALIKKLKLENKVLFSPVTWFSGFPTEDMPKIYNMADVFVLDTTGEGFGIPLIEAMSCGIPIIATDYTTTKEIVLDNDAGIGIPPSVIMTGNWNVDRAFPHEEGFARAMETLYQSKQLREEYGTNGRLAAQKFYDWDSVVFPAWMDYLKNVVLRDRV